jgi:hypothetical protein
MPRGKDLTPKQKAALQDIAHYCRFYEHVSGSWSEYGGNCDSYASITMNRLAKLGYVERRGECFHLTPEGEKAAEAFK